MVCSAKWKVFGAAASICPPSLPPHAAAGCHIFRILLSPRDVKARKQGAELVQLRGKCTCVFYCTRLPDCVAEQTPVNEHASMHMTRVVRG
jgi:hypothetical protein